MNGQGLDRMRKPMIVRQALHDRQSNSHYCHSLIFLLAGQLAAAVERSGVDAQPGRKRSACYE